jgi:uncharacterized membrane protein required for colicin V production
MNWLDILLLVILGLAAFQGLRMGLLGAAVTALGGFIGWWLAGRLGDRIGGLFSGSLSNDTLVTVLSYAIIIVLALVVTRLVWRIVKPVITVVTLGLASMVDRIGGVVLGLVLGFVVCMAVIIALARFTYNFDLPSEGVAGAVAGRLPQVEETREGLENTLVESLVTPPLVKIMTALPGNTLGFVPSDFRAALEILKQELDD